MSIGLTATTIVSQWTWSATLLQSSTVASKVKQNFHWKFPLHTHAVSCVMNECTKKSESKEVVSLEFSQQLLGFFFFLSSTIPVRHQWPLLVCGRRYHSDHPICHPVNHVENASPRSQDVLASMALA